MDSREMVVRESADGRSRVVERLVDGTFWAQEIYFDEQGRKCWRQVEVEREQVFPEQVPRYSLRHRIWLATGI